MLSVEPILERMFLTSGAAVELGRAVLAVLLLVMRVVLVVVVVRAVLLVVLVVLVLKMDCRGGRGIVWILGTSGVVPVPPAKGVLVGRGRVEALLLIVPEVEGLAGAGLERAPSVTVVFSVLAFLSSAGLLSAFAARGRRAAGALAVGRVVDAGLSAAGREGAVLGLGTSGRFSVSVLGLTSLAAVVAVGGRAVAVAGRLVPAGAVDVLGAGAFLLMGAGPLEAEVAVGRLGAAVAVEAELGRGLAELGLLNPATGLVFFSGLLKSFPGAPLVSAGLAAEGLAAAFLALSSFVSALAGFLSAGSLFSAFSSTFSSSVLSCWVFCSAFSFTSSFCSDLFSTFTSSFFSSCFSTGSSFFGENSVAFSIKSVLFSTIAAFSVSSLVLLSTFSIFSTFTGVSTW